MGRMEEFSTTRSLARPTRAPREPLFWVACALGAGILAGQFFSLPLAIWFAMGAASIAASRFVSSGRLAAILTLGVWIAIGAVRIDLSREWVADDDISILIPDEVEVPVRLHGRIASTPETEPADHTLPVWMQVARTRFDFDAQGITGSDGRSDCAGRIAVTLDGHLFNVEVGDRVTLVGRLATPTPPANPGDFDYREYLLQRGVRRILRLDHPECLTVEDQSARWRDLPMRWRGRLRGACLDLFLHRLPDDVAPLAASLLLGDRTSLSEDEESQFINSGTMHVLAISGQHVAILVLLLWWLFRATNCSLRTTTILLLGTVLLYALLTDQRPPVLRAAILSVLVLAGLPRGRIAPGLNALGASALVLLLANPNHLYDTGAQLSFLAVIAIVVAAREISRWRASAPQGPDLSPERGPISQVLRSLAGRIAYAYAITAAVWTVTLPLQTRVFHIAAPIGFVINVLLTPVVVLLLAFGYAFLLVGLVIPRWPLHSVSF
jgi:competence protein ComEC